MKITEQPVMKVLFIFFICLFLVMSVWIKFLSSTDVPINVEKNGYCKQYGEGWYNKKNTNICKEEGKPNQIEFSEEEFRNYCPKNKFLSTKFSSDCFSKSGSIV